MKVSLVVVAVLLLSVAPLRAQDETDFCTDDEIDETIIVVEESGIIPQFEAIMSISTDPDTFRTIIDQSIRAIDSIQVRWWVEVYPELPRCREAIATAYFITRTLDEMLIGVLYIRLGEAVSASRENGQPWVEMGIEHLSSVRLNWVIVQQVMQNRLSLGENED